MNHLNMMLRASSRRGQDAPVRHVRLGDPLGSALSTFDFHNKRIKLYDVMAATFIGSEPARDVLDELENGGSFSKLTLYVRDAPGSNDEKWTEAGFRKEGVIRSFYEDDSDAELWTRYANEERATPADVEAMGDALAIAKTKDNAYAALPQGWQTRPALADDAETIAGILDDTFDEYFREISAESLNRRIATSRTVIRLVEDQDRRTLATAAARLDVGRGTAQITDCVTLPDLRCKGLSTAAVNALQKDLAGRSRVGSVYALARSREVGMNCVLHRLGYEHTGTLINEVRMPSGWESMNLWCRGLA